MSLLLTEKLLNEDSVRLRELPANLRKEAASLLRRGRAFFDTERRRVRSHKSAGCCIPINDSPEAINKALSEATRFIHLQGIGKVPAILARELKVGSILSWNQAPDSYRVVAIEPLSQHFISVTTEDIKSGKKYTQKLKKDRLVSAKRG